MAKLTMTELSRKKTYVPAKPKKGQQLGEDSLKKLGNVHQLVFAPDSRTVVGFMIKRRDIAGMVKQDDKFVALDALKVSDKGVICSGEKDAFDSAACKRLGIDLDRCIVWEGCDVKTQAGKFIGYVVDACFDATTGVVDYYAAQEGSTASALVGNFEIPAAWLIGYEKGCMVVRNEAANLELSGGLAGKAGEGYATAKDKAKKATAKADEAAAKAVDKGSHALGGLIGRAQAGIKNMTEEYKEASGASSAASTSSQGADSAAASDSVEKAAQAVGSQLKKSQGMFSDFMREFKDASK